MTFEELSEGECDGRDTTKDTFDKTKGDRLQAGEWTETFEEESERKRTLKAVPDRGASQTLGRTLA